MASPPGVPHWACQPRRVVFLMQARMPFRSWIPACGQQPGLA
ncbi:MAG: hypothetical protein AB7G75_22255 [Candidatus Binatia bacterium]